MSEKNTVEVVTVPEVPKVLSNEALYIYVPQASHDTKGIASYDYKTLDIEDGVVSVKQKFLQEVIAGELWNADFSARAVLPWNANKTYGAGEYVIHGTSTNTLYYSDKIPGTAIPGEEDTVSPAWRKIFSFDEVLNNIDMLLLWRNQDTKDIQNLQSDLSSLKTSVDVIKEDLQSVQIKISSAQQVGADSVREAAKGSTVVMYAGRYYFFKYNDENYIMRAKVSDVFSYPFVSGNVDETKWEVVFNLGELTDSVLDSVKDFINKVSDASFEIVLVDSTTGYPSVETPLGNVIYLTAKENASTADAYDEWIYKNNAWEHIGSTTIDLSGYVTKDDLKTSLAEYVKRSVLDSLLESYVTETLFTQAIDNLSKQIEQVSKKDTPIATTTTVGGIKAQSGSSSGQSFPVQVNTDGTAFINIPIYTGGTV